MRCDDKKSESHNHTEPSGYLKPRITINLFEKIKLIVKLAVQRCFLE